MQGTRRKSAPVTFSAQSRLQLVVIDGWRFLPVHYYLMREQFDDPSSRCGPQRGTDMIIDSETFAEIESAVTRATQGVSAATQLVKGLGPQTEEARAYISRLLNQILEVQVHIQRASAVLDALKEANQEESSHQ